MIHDKRIGRWVIDQADGRSGQEWATLHFDYNGAVQVRVDGLRASDVHDLRYVVECLEREFAQDKGEQK